MRQRAALWAFTRWHLLAVPEPFTGGWVTSANQQPEFTDLAYPVAIVTSAIRVVDFCAVSHDVPFAGGAIVIELALRLTVRKW